LARAITDRLREDLSELLVEGTTWEDRLLIARIAELFTNDAGDRSLTGWNAIGRQVEAARRMLKPGDPTYDDIRARVSAYYARLDAAVVTDDRVVEGRGPQAGRLWRALLMVITIPLAIVGIVLWFLPYQVPRFAVRLSRGTADVVSTYKLGAGLLVHS